MNTLLEKPQLFSFGEVARILGLTKAEDYRVVSGLVRLHKIELHPMQGHRHGGISRKDVDELVRFYVPNVQ